MISYSQPELISSKVTYLLGNESTLQREFGNLAAIRDNYPKYVVSLDEFIPSHAFKGIQQFHLRDFLLKTDLPH